MLVVPGAMEAGLTSGVFWASLAFALVAFVLTTPVNRWLISRGRGTPPCTPTTTRTDRQPGRLTSRAGGPGAVAALARGARGDGGRGAGQK
ncbi:DUF4396 domain-containing protein [Micromonospora chersina]|uniref:DUF4396 domain-containing protein n=1 Tax=Micromonospora chersina TaxID=47854 RepID=UPI003791F2FA